MTILTEDKWGDSAARGWCAFNKPFCSEAWSIEYEKGYQDLKDHPEPAHVRVELSGRLAVDFDEAGAKAFLAAFKEALDMTVEFNKNPNYEKSAFQAVHYMPHEEVKKEIENG